jgi:hypothetical protein
VARFKPPFDSYACLATKLYLSSFHVINAKDDSCRYPSQMTRNEILFHNAQRNSKVVPSLSLSLSLSLYIYIYIYIYIWKVKYTRLDMIEDNLTIKIKRKWYYVYRSMKTLCMHLSFVSPVCCNTFMDGTVYNNVLCTTHACTAGRLHWWVSIIH